MFSLLLRVKVELLRGATVARQLRHRRFSLAHRLLHDLVLVVLVDVLLLLALAARRAWRRRSHRLLLVAAEGVDLVGGGLGRNGAGGFLISNMLVSHPIHMTLRVPDRVPATRRRAQLLDAAVGRRRRLLMLRLGPHLRDARTLDTVLIAVGDVRIGA